LLIIRTYLEDTTLQKELADIPVYEESQLQAFAGVW